ncbi:hypothetical protein K438DRAFT_1941582 [Mycena galopus ATCC 62051]|nr:hypothetical protein K438DRAFT_1941582 [Mycena galopus ATCC 62051]
MAPSFLASYTYDLASEPREEEVVGVCIVWGSSAPQPATNSRMPLLTKILDPDPVPAADEQQAQSHSERRCVTRRQQRSWASTSTRASLAPNFSYLHPPMRRPAGRKVRSVGRRDARRRLKHPHIRALLANGMRLAYGARALMEGELNAVPPVTRLSRRGVGWLLPVDLIRAPVSLRGPFRCQVISSNPSCAAGVVNTAKIKDAYRRGGLCGAAPRRTVRVDRESRDV